MALTEEQRTRLRVATDAGRNRIAAGPQPWEADEPDSREKYQRYLCSREWAELRQMVIHRAHGICERCLRNPLQQVHHLTYARKYMEDLADLKGLCDGCHEFTHAKSNATDPVLLEPGTWLPNIGPALIARDGIAHGISPVAIGIRLDSGGLVRIFAKAFDGSMDWIILTADRDDLILAIETALPL